MGNLTLTLLLLGIGIALFIVEMFTPGLGVSSILGLLSFLAAILLQIGNPVGMLLMVALVLFLVSVSLVVFLHVVGSKKFEKNRLVLSTKIEGTSSSLGSDDMQTFAGKTGVTLTPLRPYGKASFDNRTLDVSTTGEFLPPNAKVCITKVEGLRVVVEAVLEEE